MAVEITLNDVNSAWKTKDESTAQLFLQLIDRGNAVSSQHRLEAYTFDKFIQEINSNEFKQLTLEERASVRKEKLALLEGPNAEVPLTDKLKSHEFLLMLWQDNSRFSRQCLVDIVANVSLCYGPWKGLKAIYKQAEEKNDTEIFGAIGARIDREYAYNTGEVNQVTIAYLCRRSWRYLRTLAKSFPIAYPDAAVNFLKHYPNNTYLQYEGVAKQIMFSPDNKWEDPYNTLELWRRTPRPLFSLLETAELEEVQEFAIQMLKKEFRAVLRETDPGWVTGLANRGSKTIDNFIVWILQNTPRFEQSKFKELGLHDAVLKLFFSESNQAVKYAVEYARSNARDLEFNTLISLLAIDDKKILKFALELLAEMDPRKDIGLDGFVKIIASGNANDFAVKSLHTHFSPKELSTSWFSELLLSDNINEVEFATNNLLEFHKQKDLSLAFFDQLLLGLQRKNSWDFSYYEQDALMESSDFVLNQLGEFKLDRLDPDSIQRLLYWPPSSDYIEDWVEEEVLTLSVIDMSFLRACAYGPDWKAGDLIAGLAAEHNIRVSELSFNDSLSRLVRESMSDPRKFQAREIGFDWLLKLVKSDNSEYHNFATNLLLKSFSPADFAEASDEKKPQASTGDNVDMELASFLFTGKLKTMTRKEAGEKVKQANGKLLSSVSKNLDYLVIGDDGSPLFGEGSKGSKQVKAEDLIESGATIKIVSESGFLNMLVGGTKGADVNQQMAGCERLWDLMLSSKREDSQLAKFSLKYFRYHHVQIAKSIDDSIVDPGSEIPNEFLDFNRVYPLFKEKSKPLKELALELAKWELARWSPSIEQLIAMLELPDLAVRQLITNAIFADNKPEHRFYRIDSSKFSSKAVYRLCDSRVPEAYEAGMRLIRCNDKLQIPEQLFRLTESQNRKVRAFSIRQLWVLYREKGLSSGWSPNSTNAEQLNNHADSRSSVLRPKDAPSEQLSLRNLLRKSLFEIPKGRITSNNAPKVAHPDENISADNSRKVRLIPTSKAKLALIETIRDIALEDSQFAEYIFPLFEEFKQSIGLSEQAACLVASTRIKHTYPSLFDMQEITG